MSINEKFYLTPVLPRIIIDGSLGATGGPIKVSGLFIVVEFSDVFSIGGRGEGDHSEPELELPGEVKLFY